MRSVTAAVAQIRSIWDREGDPIPPGVALVVSAIYLVVVLARFPVLVSSPRFWAEEGSIYFQSAHDRGFASIFEPHVGYFALFPNVSTWLATHVPLAAAPIMTLVLSALAQLLSAWLAMRSRSALLPNVAKVVIVVALILSPTATSELWLNTVNSQSFFQIAAFLILLEPRLRWQHLAVLVLVFLSAPSAVFLGGFFFLRALIQKSKSSWVAAGIWTACLAVQLSSWRPGSRVSAGPDVWVLSALRENFGRAWIYNLDDGSVLSVGVMVLVLLVVIFAATKLRGAWFLGVAAFSVAFLNAAFALGGGSGPRYAFGPALMMLVVVLASLSSGFRLGFLSGVSAALVAVMLIGGSVAFHNAGYWASASWPGWRDQVVSGRKVIVIPPGGGWQVVLKH